MIPDNKFPINSHFISLFISHKINFPLLRNSLRTWQLNRTFQGDLLYQINNEQISFAFWQLNNYFKSTTNSSSHRIKKKKKKTIQFRTSRPHLLKGAGAPLSSISCAPLSRGFRPVCDFIFICTTRGRRVDLSRVSGACRCSSSVKQQGRRCHPSAARNVSRHCAV